MTERNLAKKCLKNFDPQVQSLKSIESVTLLNIERVSNLKLDLVIKLLYSNVGDNSKKPSKANLS